MRVIVGMVALLLAVRMSAQERLVLPPHLEDLAKAHDCLPVLGFVADEESGQAAPFEIYYEFEYQPPKALLAGFCKKDTRPKGSYTLLVWTEREDHPLRSCPDAIPNVTKIGHPSIEAWPMVPHEFVMMDSGERLAAKETRIMFGVQNHLLEGVDYYACVAGRWAHYSPEKK
jgi:hypothetical protein